MSKELSIINHQTKNYEPKVVIEELGEIKRIMKIHTNDPNFKSGEIMALPSEFKSLSTEEKQKALQAMEDTGLSRSEMSYFTGVSASRISQLIGKKRKQSDTELCVTFECNRPR